jgi:hypothetical protein
MEKGKITVRLRGQEKTKKAHHDYKAIKEDRKKQTDCGVAGNIGRRGK